MLTYSLWKWFLILWRPFSKAFSLLEYFYLLFVKILCSLASASCDILAPVKQGIPTNALRPIESIIEGLLWCIYVLFWGKTPSLCNLWDPGADFICAASYNTAYTIILFHSSKYLSILVVYPTQLCELLPRLLQGWNWAWYSWLQMLCFTNICSTLLCCTVHSEFTVIPTSQHSVLIGIFTLNALYFPLVSIRYLHSEWTVFPTSQHSVSSLWFPTSQHSGMFTLNALYFPLVSISVCSLWMHCISH